MAQRWSRPTHGAAGGGHSRPSHMTAALQNRGATGASAAHSRTSSHKARGTGPSVHARPQAQLAAGSAPGAKHGLSTRRMHHRTGVAASAAAAELGAALRAAALGAAAAPTSSATATDSNSKSSSPAVTSTAKIKRIPRRRARAAAVQVQEATPAQNATPTMPQQVPQQATFQAFNMSSPATQSSSSASYIQHQQLQPNRHAQASQGGGRPLMPSSASKVRLLQASRSFRARGEEHPLSDLLQTLHISQSHVTTSATESTSAAAAANVGASAQVAAVPAVQQVPQTAQRTVIVSQPAKGNPPSKGPLARQVTATTIAPPAIATGREGEGGDGAGGGGGAGASGAGGGATQPVRRPKSAPAARPQKRHPPTTPVRMQNTPTGLTASNNNGNSNSAHTGDTGAPSADFGWEDGRGIAQALFAQAVKDGIVAHPTATAAAAAAAGAGTLAVSAAANAANAATSSHSGSNVQGAVVTTGNGWSLDKAPPHAAAARGVAATQGAPRQAHATSATTVAARSKRRPASASAVSMGSRAAPNGAASASASTPTSGASRRRRPARPRSASATLTRVHSNVHEYSTGGAQQQWAWHSAMASSSGGGQGIDRRQWVQRALHSGWLEMLDPETNHLYEVLVLPWCSLCALTRTLPMPRVFRYYYNQRTQESRWTMPPAAGTRPGRSQSCSNLREAAKPRAPVPRSVPRTSRFHRPVAPTSSITNLYTRKAKPRVRPQSSHPRTAASQREKRETRAAERKSRPRPKSSTGLRRRPRQRVPACVWCGGPHASHKCSRRPADKRTRHRSTARSVVRTHAV